MLDLKKQNEQMFIDKLRQRQQQAEKIRELQESNKLMREQAALRIEQAKESVHSLKQKQYSLEKHLKTEHRIEMNNSETAGVADRYSTV